MDLPRDQLEQTVVSVSRVYRNFGFFAGLVYRQMNEYVNLARHVISSIKMAIHTSGHPHKSDGAEMSGVRSVSTPP